MKRKILQRDEENVLNIVAENYDIIDDFIRKNTKSCCSSISGVPTEIKYSNGHQKHILDVYYKDGSCNLYEVETTDIREYINELEALPGVESVDYIGVQMMTIIL